ncbi:hypothetical protein JTB14_006309 [Gonioctena quinquepunctata]|nr:hypothetical protein JTB14_006309 [Gonioctena quinquepunctata]
MAPNYSKVFNKNNALAGAGALTAIWLIASRKYNKSVKLERKKSKKNEEEEVKYLIAEKEETKSKAQLDRKFFVELSQLFKIAVPGWTSAECGLFILIAASLVSRSMCDLWLIDNGTKIETSIISMDKSLFRKRLVSYFLAIPVVAVVNNVLKYSIGALKIQLRTNMTRRLYEEYLKNYTWFQWTTG